MKPKAKPREHKWYGKVIFRNEGIETYSESETEAEAKAFVNGFEYAKELSQQCDDDVLEDYWTCVDQVKPVEE